jgi:hypothetical protein
MRKGKWISVLSNMLSFHSFYVQLPLHAGVGRNVLSDIRGTAMLEMYVWVWIILLYSFRSIDVPRAIVLQHVACGSSSIKSAIMDSLVQLSQYVERLWLIDEAMTIFHKSFPCSVQCPLNSAGRGNIGVVGLSDFSEVGTSRIGTCHLSYYSDSGSGKASSLMEDKRCAHMEGGCWGAMSAEGKGGDGFLKDFR